jgi:hypothetical protein
MKYYAISEDKDVFFFEGTYDQVGNYLKFQYPKVKFDIYEIDDSTFLDLSKFDQSITKKEKINKLKKKLKSMI